MPQLSGKPRTLGCLHEFLRCLCCAAHVTSLSGFCGLFQRIGMLCGQAAAAQELWGIPPCSRGALLALCREAVTEMNRRFGEGQG